MAGRDAQLRSQLCRERAVCSYKPIQAKVLTPWPQKSHDIGQVKQEDVSTPVEGGGRKTIGAWLVSRAPLSHDSVTGLPELLTAFLGLRTATFALGAYDRPRSLIREPEQVLGSRHYRAPILEVRK